MRLFKGNTYDTRRGPLQTCCCSAIDRISVALYSTDRAALEDDGCFGKELDSAIDAAKGQEK